MAVSAKKVANRDVYEVSYENSKGSGTVHAVFTNTADGDKSSTVEADDGKFTVTVATGWTGEDSVTVTHEDGDELDSGTVTFG